MSVRRFVASAYHFGLYFERRLFPAYFMKNKMYFKHFIHLLTLQKQISIKRIFHVLCLFLLNSKYFFSSCPSSLCSVCLAVCFLSYMCVGVFFCLLCVCVFFFYVCVSVCLLVFLSVCISLSSSEL